MDHRPLRNLLVFLVFFLLTFWYGMASAVELWRVSSISIPFGTPANCPADPNGTNLMPLSALVDCFPSQVVNGGYVFPLAMDHPGNVFPPAPSTGHVRFYYGPETPGGSTYVSGTLYAYPEQRCEPGEDWDQANQTCITTPTPCPVESLVNLRRSGTGTAPDPICFGGCEYTSSPLTLYLPLVDQYYAEYYATGQQCTEADDNNPSTTPPVHRAPPVTQTDVSAPIVGVDQSGNPQTVQETLTTTTIEPGITTSTETQIIEVGTDTVSRETTTTVTTYPDGSMETVVQTTYTNTTAEKNIYDLIANTVTNQPSSVTTGTRTTSTTINPDGSSSSTTTQTGTPDGTGEGEGEGEEPCGYFVPQFICDFFSDDTPAPEHDAMPVTEVGDEFVSWSSGLSSGTCPSSVSASFMGQSFAYDYTDACYAAETFFRPILLAIAAIVAAMIIVGARI